MGFTLPNRSKRNETVTARHQSVDRDGTRFDQRWSSRSFNRFPSDGNLVDYAAAGSKSLPLGVGVVGGRGTMPSATGHSDVSVKLSESLAESQHLREKLEVTESKLSQCEREVQ